jgi:hypothetical protein
MSVLRRNYEVVVDANVEMEQGAGAESGDAALTSSQSALS